MTSILCDASPLIFLAKLDHLDLINRVLDGQVFVLQCVIDELQTESASPKEVERLALFFQSVEVIDFEITDLESSALSRSDQSTLRWAIENDVDWLLADERLLRRVANEEEIKVIGFLGLLVGAAASRIITPSEAREAVDEAVSQHGCRISVAVYQRVLGELGEITK